jgi:hypothetical protein
VENLSSVVATTHCVFIAANLALLSLPTRRAELRFWRRLKIQHLRRQLTKKSKVHQPLSFETASTARKNVAWHVALTAVMLVAALNASKWSGVVPAALQALTVLPTIAWFIGSLVQRQKLVLVNQLWTTTAREHVGTYK